MILFAHNLYLSHYGVLFYLMIWPLLRFYLGQRFVIIFAVFLKSSRPRRLRLWWREFIVVTFSLAKMVTLSTNFCLVLLQVPKCFVLVQIFWASPKIWLHLVPLQKLLCRHKNQFYWMQIIFLSGTKFL